MCLPPDRLGLGLFSEAIAKVPLDGIIDSVAAMGCQLRFRLTLGPEFDDPTVSWLLAGYRDRTCKRELMSTLAKRYGNFTLAYDVAVGDKVTQASWGRTSCRL